ncbi:MAG TPA: RNA polymerase sigma factor [Gemmatimonadaceae bacterium]|nr:RNA polymerase sigma factor [Gemmatimonadaceae bacterium]
MTDASLVQRALTRDASAFALLVERYHERSLRFAWQMLGNRHDAEEAVQDAFVRAYRSLPKYEERDRFGAWLLQILVNRCRSVGARRRRDQLALAAAAPDATQSDHPAERAAWREEIVYALGRLDAAHREAFLLKHVEELSYEEMAAVTGVGVSALKMRVKRACAELRALLAEVERV